MRFGKRISGSQMRGRVSLRRQSILLTLARFTSSSEAARAQTQEVLEDYFGSAAGYKRLCRERCARFADWLKAPIEASAFARPMTFKEFLGTLYEQWAAQKME